MIVTAFALGAAMTTFAGGSAYHYIKKGGDIRKKLKHALYESALFHEHRQRDGKRIIQECGITSCYKEKWGFDITIELPVGLTATKIRNSLEALEMALDGEIQMESDARYVRFKIGMLPLKETMNFNDKLIPEDGQIQIPFYTRFGIEHLNFNTEMGAHLLGAGATGMGKSKLLDLIIACILLATNGNVKIVLVNNKLVDAAKYRGINCLTIHDELADSIYQINAVLQELHRRKDYMAKAGITNTKDSIEPMPPIFVVIDEYARFSDEKDFQNAVVEIAELGRSFDIHLIIATQRPDAKEVLNPRIKANCLTKIAFKTTTSSNSRVILETDEAAHLPNIQGRAIIQRSTNMQVQVPYISDEQLAVLLKPFKVGPPLAEIASTIDPSIPTNRETKPITDDSTKLEKETKIESAKVRYMKDKKKRGKK